MSARDYAIVLVILVFIRLCNILSIFIMTGGYVDLHSVQLASEPVQLNRIRAAELTSDVVFDGMQERIKADPSLIKKINGIFVYNVAKNGKPAAVWSECRTQKMLLAPGTCCGL